MTALGTNLPALHRRKVLVGLAGFPFIASCGGIAPDPPGKNVGVRAHPALQSQIGVMVDPRIELMTIIQRLSGYFLLSSYETFASREVEQYFGDFADHPVVDSYAQLTELGFAFDKVPRFMMHFDPEPGFEVVLDWRWMAEGIPDLENALERFAMHMRDFAYRTETMTAS